VFFAPYQECNIAYYRGRIGKKILEWNVIDHGMKSMFAYVSYVTAPLSWYTLVSVFFTIYKVLIFSCKLMNFVLFLQVSIFFCIKDEDDYQE
jgi:hypothetical protein